MAKRTYSCAGNGFYGSYDPCLIGYSRPLSPGSLFAPGIDIYALSHDPFVALSRTSSVASISNTWLKVCDQYCLLSAGREVLRST